MIFKMQKAIVLLFFCVSFKSAAAVEEKQGLFWFCCDCHVEEFIVILLLTCLGENLVVVTVATHVTDGFQRFNRSVNLYGLKLEVII